MRTLFFMVFVLGIIMLAAPEAMSDTASGEIASVQTFKNGADVYEHICQACHMRDGKGAKNIVGVGFPTLASNPKLQYPVYPAQMVLNGHGGMPWFSGLLTDKQVVDVVNYIRTHFGNQWDDKIAPEQVAQMRRPVTLEP